MRPFEIQLGITLAVGALILAAGPFKGVPLMIVGGLISVAVLAHLGMEGWRVQAIPLYAAALLVGVMALVPMPKIGRLAISAVGLMGAAAGLVLCYAIPVFDLPAPTGPLAIGTTTLYLQDDARMEIHDSNPRAPRKFVAQLWYPAQGCSGFSRSTYRDTAALRLKSLHMKYVKTHSCVDAPVLHGPAKWPVVLFSPSSGGYRSQNSFLVEDLVSHGYVVIGVDHPYSSSRVVFPDGAVIHSLGNDWLQLASKESLAISIPIVEATLATRVRDMQFVYDLMAGLQLKGNALEVSRAVDYDRAGALGHSYGGAAAAELCRIDERFKAGINFDGWMFSGVRESGISKPFLFVIEDDPLWLTRDGTGIEDQLDLSVSGTKDYHAMILRSGAHWGGYLLRPTGMMHRDFADMSLYTRWPAPGGNPKAQKGHRLMRDFTLAFFEKHLRGKPAALLAASARTEDYELILMRKE